VAIAVIGVAVGVALVAVGTVGAIGMALLSG
jgi:hypothetical protein